jgi:hypothetical protein
MRRPSNPAALAKLAAIRAQYEARIAKPTVTAKRKRTHPSAAKNRDAYFRDRKPPGPLKADVGDRVAYTRYFLRCTGEPPTGDRWHARGVVVALMPRFDWVSVLWDGDSVPVVVSLHALAFPTPNARFVI